MTLEPRQGEALGIIGPNGAGKSTMLKLLTKILRPTDGRCELRGRVGALIEVAAGFHPDLTGRENVDLQGAIMGMKRAEIARKFDQIVEFSGIADFIDAPVRRYSSGMNARLGFAIAAHLEPEVLIVDEVLAVGDFAFQQRAFGRIQEMVNQNVTTIIVSHQLERIAFLCKRAVLLRQGEVAHSGPAAETIAAYVSGVTEETQEDSADCPLLIRRAELVTDGRTASGSRILIRVDADVVDPARLVETAGVGVRVRSMQNGKVLFATSTLRQGLSLEGLSRFTLEVGLQLNTAPGVYTIETVVFDRKRNQTLGTGPWVNVTVCDGKSFIGEVQMNPEMVLRSPASTNDQREPAGALRPFAPNEEIHAPAGSRDRILKSIVSLGRTLRHLRPNAGSDDDFTASSVTGQCAIVRRWAHWPHKTTSPYFPQFYGALQPHGVVPVATMGNKVGWLATEQADVLHFHWPDSFWRRDFGRYLGRVKGIWNAREYLRTAKRAGLKIVWTVHNHDAHEGGDWLDVMGYRILADEADLIICHTRWSADAVVRTYRPTGAIVVMSHGNMDGVYPVARPRSIVAAELGLDPKRPIVSCLGYLRRYKGLELACEAVQRLQGEVQWLIAGPPRRDTICGPCAKRRPLCRTSS